ncbi:MAG: hypothetical protein AAGI54_02140 [Planctomycetota bacterium]
MDTSDQPKITGRKGLAIVWVPIGFLLGAAGGAALATGLTFLICLTIHSVTGSEAVMVYGMILSILVGLFAALAGGVVLAALPFLKRSPEPTDTDA